MNLQTAASGIIQRFGEQLTVTRRAATQGGSVTTQSVYFLPQPLNERETDTLVSEGIINAAEANAHRFVAPGDSDVQENIDVIIYDGWEWRVNHVTGRRMNGVYSSLYCYATREARV